MLGDRLFVDAVILRARTGIQWAQVFRELQIDADDTASIVDGTTVGAHQDAS